jgi:excisionase family DNA binding protein
MPALPDPQTKALLTVSQAAEILEVNERTVYNLVDKRKS